MKQYLGIWWVALLLCPVAGAGASPDAPDVESMLGHVRVLTAPVFAGRGSGSQELWTAADTLAGWMADAGLSPAFTGSWYQPFVLRGEGWTGNDLAGLRDRNVAGVWPGQGELSERFVVIGAHYDHLGRLVVGSGEAPLPGPTDYYPGANDNASGVAVVLEIARLLPGLVADAPSRRSVLLVFFAGEEVGLQGSGYFVEHPPMGLDRVDVMINFDTVGQITDNRLYVSGVGTAAGLAGMVEAAREPGVQLTVGSGGWSGSDHMSFNQHEVPVVFVFGGPYPQYNRPADTWDALTPSGLAQVAGFGASLAAQAVTRKEPLVWQDVAVKNERRGDTSGENRDTWFGSLPDFSEEIVGYKLGGVFDGSPAAAAGLEKGDVLIRLAGAEIADLVDFTHNLRSHDPGDLVEVEVLRQGRSLKFTVVLGNRAERK